MSTELNTTEQVKENEKFTNEISILDVVVLMMRNWWVIVLTGLVFAVVCYAYSKSVSVPTYVSTGSLYINTQQTQLTGDVNATALYDATTLMPTYIEILKSRSFNQEISEKMGGKYTYSQIDSMIKLSQVEDTNIMNIKVTCRDKEDSHQICEYAITAGMNKLKTVFKGGDVTPIDTPQEEPTVSMVNLFQRGIIGFLVGAVLATIVIVLFDIFDTRITNSDELTAKYKLPILGEIPNLTELS